MATSPLPTPAPTPAPAPMPTPAPTPAPKPTGMMFSSAAPAPLPEPPVPTAAQRRPDVDFNNETVEGRIGGLLQTNPDGTYVNQVVRQAVDRQNQTFNARGLLNSSMAAQAGQEAAISKATEIAAADAAVYQRERERLDEQDFQLRGDYQKAVQDVNTNFQKMVDTINASQMTPEDKSVAIAQAQGVRDGELAYQNNLFSAMPRWKNEWLAVAVPTGGIDVASIGNQDTLSNIVNDPAQPADRRAQARARLEMLRAGAGAGAATASAGPTETQRFEQYRAEGGWLPLEMWRRMGAPAGGLQRESSVI